MRKARVLIICMSFFLVCCNVPKEPKYVPTPEILKAFSFKIGSYWIYQDAISGVVDSFYVDKNEFVTYGDFKVNEIQILQTAVDNFWRIDLRLAAMSIKSGFVLYNKLFEYPFNNGYILGTDSSFNFGELNNHVIGLNSYPKLHMINHRLNKTYSGAVPHNDTFLVSDEIGFVQMKLHNYFNNEHRDWQLIRYKIVK